ncbi:MAG: YceI family protein [Oceanospirillaceae bacterium]|nr:YceI family protein [Oceanospirillaceae bacterium]
MSVLNPFPVVPFILVLSALCTPPVTAASYNLDPTHSFIEFRTKHLGYSWLYGRFNRVEGHFTWDKSRPQASKINVNVDLASLDSNHAERDKHLRGDEYLDARKYRDVKFVSRRYEGDADSGVVYGTLTLRGVSRELQIPVNRIGEGHDPWGGYRVGFEGKVTLDAFDYGMQYDVGPGGNVIELFLGIEGIKKKKLAPKRR